MTLQALGTRVAYEPERSLGHTSFAAMSAYTKLGNTALSHPICILILQNLTDVPVSFSLDGTNSLITLASGVTLELYCATNASSQGGDLNIAAGTQLWAAGAPSTGSAYATAIYRAGAGSTN